MDSPHITSRTLCSVVTKLYNTCTFFVNDPSTFHMRGNFTLTAVETLVHRNFLDFVGHISEIRTIFIFSTTHCSLLRLIVRSGLDVSTFSHQASPCVSPRESTQWRKVELWARNVREFCLNAEFQVTFRDLLHAVKLRNGTEGFTSPPREGVLRIFSP